ncbi:MAG TPA: hypothetical protein PKK43_17450, partial [Spirochaetota bacterium]|nr:hypothetical protein [Spirochaetota bacterium]
RTIEPIQSRSRLECPRMIFIVTNTLLLLNSSAGIRIVLEIGNLDSASRVTMNAPVGFLYVRITY